jgi:beta-lactamase superfamily II metal-dependent hydrolase
VQLPHHGSDGYFNDNFLSMNAFFIASAEMNGRWKHPGIDVIEKLKKNGKTLWHVKEHESSCVCTRVQKGAGWTFYHNGWRVCMN